MAACARRFTSWMDASDSGDSESSRILSPSCESELAVEPGVPRSEEGRSVNFSSAEDAVEGRRSWPLCDRAGRGSRGAGERVMCGAVAARKATSLSDGAEDDGCGASSDRERERRAGRRSMDDTWSVPLPAM